MKKRLLLDVDGVINLLLGVGLVSFPQTLVEALGIPGTNERFYPLVLGAVLFGIGLALLLERFRQENHGVGLGLGGAVAINICGALAVAIWLVASASTIPLRGQVFLWSLVAALVVLSTVEIWSELQKSGRDGRHNRFA